MNVSSVPYNNFPLGPYHKQTDDTQVNRFLEPMDKYSHENDSLESLHTHNIKNTSVSGKERSKPINLIEYDNIKHLYGTEYEHSIHNALKQKAINASQEFLLDTKNIKKRDAFVESQYKLRQWRGQYIADNIRKGVHPTPFGFKFENEGEMILKQTNLVEFSCTENNKPAIPFPIVAKVDKEYDILKLAQKNLQLAHVIDIISDAHTRILRQYKESKEKCEILNQIVIEIKKHAAEETSRQNSPAGLGLGLSAERWDDTARMSIDTGGWKTVKFTLHARDYEFKYRCAVNIIIPTKIKMEHNVKTVHRFALDFSKILKPMHVDLIVHMGQSEFVWTINEFEQNKHKVFQAGYVSNDNRMFEMPKTLEDMTKKHGSEEYLGKFFRKASIESACIDRNDYSSLLNLHVYLARSKLQDMNGLAQTDPQSADDTSHYTDVGYIYKYNQYTIVASGIRHPSQPILAGESQPASQSDTNLFSTFYTIIHWNNSPVFHNSAAAPDPAMQLVASLSKKDQIDLKGVYEYVLGINEQIGKLVPHRIIVPEAALDRVDIFIPSVLMTRVSNNEPNSSGIQDQTTVHGTLMGAYFIEKCTKEDRDMISIYRKRLEHSLLIEYYNLSPGPTEKVMGAMIDQMKQVFFSGKDFKIPPVPGYFGKYLQLTHNIRTPYTHSSHVIQASDHRTGMERWSDFWHEFFKSRPELNAKLLEEASPQMKILNAQHEDRIVKNSLYRNQQGNRVGNNTHRYSQGMRPANLQSGSRFQPTHIPLHNGQQQFHSNYSTHAPMPVPHWAGHSSGPIGPYGRPLEIPNRYIQNLRWGGRYAQADSEYSKRKSGSHSLAAAIESPEPTPHSKLQAEIDMLKRTLNELTLRTPINQ